MRAGRLFGGLLVLVLLAPTPALAAPEIYSLDPEKGPAGTPIKLKGKGLETAHHVIFAVGRTVKSARFRVVSDRELEVLSPDYFRPQAAATVAVFTREAVVVAMPASVQTVWNRVAGRSAAEQGATLYHVMPGGVVPNAASVAVIEAGGTVQRSDSPGMHFVKRGGTLLYYPNANGIVFHEPGPSISRENFFLRTPPTYITVPHIVVSPGVGPFIYEGAPRPANLPARLRLPYIDGFTPRSAAAGDIVTLSGRGFSRTQSVWFKEPSKRPTLTGFRIVSDEELKVEVPDESEESGPELIMVLTTEGLTVTVPRDRVVRAAVVQRPMNEWFQPIMWVPPGDVTVVPSGDAIVIDEGGVVVNSRGNVFFVKRGGRLADQAIGRADVFYEPRANVSDLVRNSPHSHEVAHIVPSYFPAPFTVVPGPGFRR